MSKLVFKKSGAHHTAIINDGLSFQLHQTPNRVTGLVYEGLKTFTLFTIQADPFTSTITDEELIEGGKEILRRHYEKTNL